MPHTWRAYNSGHGTIAQEALDSVTSWAITNICYKYDSRLGVKMHAVRRRNQPRSLHCRCQPEQRVARDEFTHVRTKFPASLNTKTGGAELFRWATWISLPGTVVSTATAVTEDTLPIYSVGQAGQSASSLNEMPATPVLNVTHTRATSNVTDEIRWLVRVNRSLMTACNPGDVLWRGLLSGKSAPKGSCLQDTNSTKVVYHFWLCVWIRYQP